MRLFLYPFSVKQKFLWFAALVVVGIRAEAYPEFIGFGYASCLTCHFNGHGSGALNDYGRALWSAEIASRQFYSATKTDEQIAESSGFIGKKVMPWWIRPAIKYRGLWNKSDYGSPKAQEKIYNMQIDTNLVFRFDPDEKFIFYITEGYRPNSTMDPSRNLNRWMSREYWARLHVGESYWLYAGLMDKVFGLRNIDHTSYTRTYQRLSQYDQTLGIVAHKIEPEWELTGQSFFGNPDEAEDARQKGFSVLYDREIGEKKRISLSYLGSKSNTDAYQLTALSYRGALSKGSSLMAEYGFRQYTVAATSVQKSGSWLALHSFVQLTRGYNFHSSLERFNEEFKPSSPDKWKWTLGFIMFPTARIEFRTDLVTKREITEVGAIDDTWALQGQLHVSL